jgi:hypothetical protein
MKKRFVAPVLRQELTLAQLTLIPACSPAASCDNF